MDDVVYKFKRYEDASLVYTGINTHQGEPVGGFDTVISEQTYRNQVPRVDLSWEFVYLCCFLYVINIKSKKVMSFLVFIVLWIILSAIQDASKG